MRALGVLVALVVLLFGTFSLAAADSRNIPEYLSSISVTINTPVSVGSGVAFTRKDANGNDVTFIWTVGHIPHHEDDGDLNSILNIIKSGLTNIAPKFTDYTNLIISQDVNIDGKYAYTTNLDAITIKISPVDTGEDLAVLRVNGKFFNTNTVTFDLSGRIPKLGEPLYDVSSAYGEDRCFSAGNIAAIGRSNDGKYYDQTTLVVFPGSSGGGAYTTDGKCIGLNDVMRAPCANYIVPIRRMQEWAKREGILWALDPSVPMPSDEKLKSIPLLDTKSRPIVKKHD